MFTDTDQPENEIKKISLYSSSEGYVGFRDWIGYTVDSGRTFIRKEVTWENVNFNGYYPNLTFGFYICGVKAFNRNKLIAYGHYGMVPAILVSTDAGNTFKLVFHSQYNMLEPAGGVADMLFPQNESVGYACDPDGILKTTDGGLTWSVSRNEREAFFSNLESVDNNTVFAFSTYTEKTKGTSNKLLKTTNGGSSWQNIVFPLSESEIIQYAYFRTALTGWVNVGGNLYKTSNGGGSWQLVNVPGVTSFGCVKMKFLDDNTAYAIGGAFRCLKTTDGGKIWEPLARDNTFAYYYFSHNDMFFRDNQQFWVGGAGGLLEMTTNGGGQTLPVSRFVIDTTGVYPGGHVNLVNYSKTSYTYKWYVNGVFISSDYNAFYQHATMKARDSIQLVVSDGINTDTLERYQHYDVPAVPQVTAFSPSSGSNGTWITIDGINLSAVTGVKFGSSPAASFSIVSSTRITAVVAAGSTGDVVLENVYGSYSLPGFTYFPVPSASPPLISSFSPQSGLTGTTVTITGNNFNPVPGGNTVRFGAATATVLTASATQLTCTVPAGTSYEPISILNNTTRLAGTSRNAFNVVFADSSNFTTSSFKKVIGYQIPSPNHPQFLAVNDINLDGKPDLFCYGCDRSSYTDSITVYPNASTGNTISFGEKISVAGIPANSNSQFSFADIDGDGQLDIVASAILSSVFVCRNQTANGVVSFAEHLTLPAGDYQPKDVLAADLDNDGRPEIVCGGYESGNVSVLRNTSSPGYISFAYRQLFKSAGRVRMLASADIDGDGKTDIAAFNSEVTDALSVTIFRNQGTPGTLALIKIADLPVQGTTGTGGRNLSFADYDLDGKPDLIVFNGTNQSIYRNTSVAGAISFEAAVYRSIRGSSTGPSVASLSGDNRPDLVSGAWSGYRSLSLYRNISTPGLAASDTAVVLSSYLSYYTATGDFNLDGKTDIASCDANFDIISILQNNMGAEISFASCDGLYATIVADIPASSYQWQVNNGSGFTNISDGVNFNGATNDTLKISQIPLTWNGYGFRCISGTNKSSTFRLNVNPVPLPVVSISTPDTVVCANTKITFSSNLINPGNDTRYVWRLNGKMIGDDAPAFSTKSLKNNDVVSLRVTAYDACGRVHYDTSNYIKMTVNGGIPSVSVTAPGITVCQGAAVTFTANPVFGGSPSYQWQVNGVNGGTNSPVFTTSTLNDKDIVRVLMTANGNCLSPVPVTSTGYIMTVNPYATPSLTISGPGMLACPGDIITFTPQPLNGGSSPSYHWELNGTTAGTGKYYSSTTLAAGDIIKCTMTSSLVCVTTAVATANTNTLQEGICIPPDNFAVAVASLSCAGKNDGTITVLLKKDLGYTATTTGPGGYSRSEHFSGLSYNVPGLAAGKYTICFSADNVPGYLQCFSVTVTEPPPLRVMSGLGADERTVTLDMEGSEEYFITVNGTTAMATQPAAIVQLQEGINEIEVSTGRICQGVFRQIFFTGSRIKLFPNPANDVARLWIPGRDSRATIKVVAAATGTEIRRSVVAIGSDRGVKLNLAGYAAGVYIIQVNGTNVNGHVKMIKK